MHNADMQDEWRLELENLQILYEKLDSMGKNLRKVYLKRQFKEFVKIDKELKTLIEEDFKKSAIFRKFFYHRECKFWVLLFFAHLFKNTPFLI